jgi:hypothetical protein
VSVLKVSSLPDAGDFRSGRLAWDVLRATSTHAQQLPGEVDLTDCVMLKPYSIACLAALGAKGGRAPRLVLPSEEACRDHVLRVGLSTFFADDPGAKQPEVRPTNVVTRQVADRPGIVSNEIIAVLSDNMHLAVNTPRELANHLDEIILNAVTHSGSAIGCVVAGQAFPRNRSIEIAVVDLGCTILGHLQRHPDHRDLASDGDAILLATLEGVSGTVGRNRWGDENGGYGLFALREYCESGHGELAVLSGTHFVCFNEEGAPKTTRFRGNFAGCLVSVRFSI